MASAEPGRADPASRNGLYTLTPCRVVDTRGPNGPWGGPALAANSDRAFQISGRCGIPAGAEAVALNLTATAATKAGNLRAYATGGPFPNASAINYKPTVARANNGSYPISSDGSLTIRCDQSSGSVHVIIDVVGYYEADPPAPPPTGGAHIWSKDFGGLSVGGDSATPVGVVVDGAGASIVLGLLKGTVNFGGGNLTSAGVGDVYLAKYGANGAHQWSRRFGGPDDDRPKGLALDASGNIVITGFFRQTADFGGGPLTAPPTTANAFLAKYSPSGAHIWSLRLGTGISEGSAVAFDGAGNVILAAGFTSTSDFGGGSMTTAGSYDIALAKYNASGGHIWSKRIGGTGSDSATAVAVDSTTGEIWLTGYFAGAVDFGGGTLPSAGLNDAFLARYSSSGGHVWSRRWGGASEDKAYSVALDSVGSVAVTGMFTGNVDFGGGPLSNPTGGDIFLVKYSAGGLHLWSRGFGSDVAVTEYGYGVSFDDSGNVLLTGSLAAPVDFGGGLLSGDGWYNPFVAKFGPAGTHVWSKRFVAGGAHANGRSVAADSGGNVLLTGEFNTSINFGGTTLTSPGAADNYLAKLGP